MDILPEYFKCPISLDIMSDPVILTSGHTFDRTSIRRWIDAGNSTCPITKIPLQSPPLLIPNHALRVLISAYAPHRYQDPLASFKSEVESSSELVPELNSASSSAGEKADCGSLLSYIATTLNDAGSPVETDADLLRRLMLKRLVRLTKTNKGLYSRLVESGAASAVLGCVDSEDPCLQEMALCFLLETTLDNDDKDTLVLEGAIGKLVPALRGRSAALAARTLTSLATSEANKAAIGAYPGAIRGLVSLLSTGDIIDSKEAAITALFAICSFPENRRRVVDCGAVPTLLRMARSGVERAIGVVGLLARCHEGREEMVKCDEVVEILVGYVKNGNSREVLYGLLTLSSLCCCEKVKKEMKNQEVVKICLGLIHDDNHKISKFAFQLRKLLLED